jgi:hypothetical protein
MYRVGGRPLLQEVPSEAAAISVDAERVREAEASMVTSCTALGGT